MWPPEDPRGLTGTGTGTGSSLQFTPSTSVYSKFSYVYVQFSQVLSFVRISQILQTLPQSP